jgi:hypothetical protein
VNGVQSSNVPPSFQITPQLVFGLLIVFVGIIFTLEELGITGATSYLRYWPSAIIVIGVLKLLQAREGSGAFVGLLITIVGAWLQAEELDVIHVSLREVWPIGLVLLGGYLVWQGLSRPPAPPSPPQLDPLPPLDASFSSGGWTSPPSPPPPSPGTRSSAAGEPSSDASFGRPFSDGGSRRPAPDNSTMSVVAIMGGVTRGNNSSTFRRADLLAFMGGCEIDLRKASINGEAVIDVFCMWGGIEIRVPEDWTVVSHIVPLMGGVEDKTRPPQAATAHRLTLRGMALMAGIEIKN